MRALKFVSISYLGHWNLFRQGCMKFQNGEIITVEGIFFCDKKSVVCVAPPAGETELK